MSLARRKLESVNSMEDLEKLQVTDFMGEEMYLGENEILETQEEEKSTENVNQKMLKIGSSILREMGEEAVEVGSMSSTLHFVTLLGLASKPTVRKTAEGNVTCPTTIGVTLISDKPIEVPVISVLKNRDTGITAQDISSRRVRRGVPFHLNMYELMFLMVRKEYAGFIEYNGDPQGVYFSPKMSYYYNGKAKFPTPTLSFKLGKGSIKEYMVVIDEKVGGKWAIKPEYEKEFGELYPKKEDKKAQRRKIKHPNTVAVNLALGKILEENLGLEA